jgi:hypothetical protein
VTIASCHDVDPSPSVYARQASAKVGLLGSWTLTEGSKTETHSTSLNGNTLIHRIVTQFSDGTVFDDTYVIPIGAVRVSIDSNGTGLTVYCKSSHCIH